MYTRPNDVRGFIHKKIFGGLKGAIGGFLGGGPLGALGGAAKGFAGARERSLVQRAIPFTALGAQAPAIPVRVSDTEGRCPSGFVMTTNDCMPASQFRNGKFLGFQGDPNAPSVVPDLPPGASRQFFEGQATMGRFGAALEPTRVQGVTRVCPRGAVLAVDGLCYNRRDIKNSERWWPRGRRPLLTGGEMRCITVAARAATKLKAKQKQLEQLGLLKKPSRRAAKQLGPGHVGLVKHA